MAAPTSSSPDPRLGTVIGIGELLWDCFGDTRRPGGAPANVAYHASLLGHRGIVCSRVGRDALGDEIVANLEAHRVDVGHIQRDANHPTGTVIVDAGRPEHPKYHITEDVAWDYLECDEGVEQLAAAADAVCFGTLMQRTTAAGEALHRFLAAADNALVVYDVNLRPPAYTLEAIERSLRAAHVAKLNDGEASTLSDMIGVAAEPRALAEALFERYGVELVCVTRGGDGCGVYTPDDALAVDGRPVKVADAVGAGDAFSAGLISGLLRGWSPQRTARFANELGGLIASRPGAMPDSKDASDELVERYERMEDPDDAGGQGRRWSLHHALQRPRPGSRN